MLSASIIDSYNRQLIEKVDEWIASNNEGHRGHLGFSVIGDDDEHKQWMNFHWCLPNDFDGRMLRLFDLGNRIEDQVVENIRDSKEVLWERMTRKLKIPKPLEGSISLLN